MPQQSLYNESIRKQNRLRSGALPCRPVISRFPIQNINLIQGGAMLYPFANLLLLALALTGLWQLADAARSGHFFAEAHRRWP